MKEWKYLGRIRDKNGRIIAYRVEMPGGLYLSMPISVLRDAMYQGQAVQYLRLSGGKVVESQAGHAMVMPNRTFVDPSTLDIGFTTGVSAGYVMNEISQLFCKRMLWAIGEHHVELSTQCGLLTEAPAECRWKQSVGIYGLPKQKSLLMAEIRVGSAPSMLGGNAPGIVVRLAELSPTKVKYYGYEVVVPITWRVLSVETVQAATAAISMFVKLLPKELKLAIKGQHNK